MYYLLDYFHQKAFFNCYHDDGEKIKYIMWRSFGWVELTSEKEALVSCLQLEQE